MDQYDCPFCNLKNKWRILKLDFEVIFECRDEAFHVVVERGLCQLKRPSSNWAFSNGVKSLLSHDAADFLERPQCRLGRFKSTSRLHECKGRADSAER